MKDKLVAVLTEALARENSWEQGEGRGRYRCIECGSDCSLDAHGGCVNQDCWIESAEILLRKLQRAAGRDRSKA